MLLLLLLLVVVLLRLLLMLLLVVGVALSRNFSSMKCCEYEHIFGAADIASAYFLLRRILACRVLRAR